MNHAASLHALFLSTAALARAMCLQTTKAYPLRLWIVDNSGSMREADGRRLVASSSKTNVRWTQTTRWDELKDTVTYHAQLAALLLAPTQFMVRYILKRSVHYGHRRQVCSLTILTKLCHSSSLQLLNPPADNGLHQMGVAEMGADMVEEDLHSLRHALNSTSPGGATPLTRHLNNIFALVSSMKSQLDKEGHRVVVVLATDGVPTNTSGHSGWKVDEDFEQALQRLQTLPVWIVVRLCTNDERVVQYYQNLDDRLEWSLEVLDDFVDEAKEVYRYNPWLNYALPLHRCREWGFPSRLMDLLDERTLTLEEMSDFLQLVFADSFNYLPDPAVDWEDFKKRVCKMIEQEEQPWNPSKKKAAPWIDMRQLENTYGPHRHQRQLAIMGTSAFVAVCVLWHLVSNMLQNVWQSALLAPSPSPTPVLTETAMPLTANGLIWILGGIVLMLLYLPRGPPNMKLVLALLGVILTLALPSLWSKSASFWKGAGWMAGGLVLLFLVAAFNDR